MTSLRLRRLIPAAALVTAVTVLHAQNAAVTVTVDAAPTAATINPAIYGVAYATHGAAAGSERAAAPLRRQQHLALQLAAERRQPRRGLVFREHRRSRAPPPDSAATTSSSTAAPAVPSRWSPSRSSNTSPSSAAIASKLASFDSRVYGAQDDCDWQWFPQACNGMKRRAAGRRQQSARCQRAEQHGASGRLGLAFRPALRPGGGRRAQVLHPRQRVQHLAFDASRRAADRRDDGAGARSMIAYSGAIKNVDPGALVVGPEEWGWSGYLFSGYDQQYGSQHGWSFLPDRAAHGGMDYLPWLLQAAEDAIRHRSAPRHRRVHRSLLPAGRRVLAGRRRQHARCSCAATARRVRCGIRPTPTRRGSTTRCSSFRVCAPG